MASLSTGVPGDSGDYAWIMASTALVFMMIPGIALFYSGLRSQGTALSLIWLSMMATSVVTIQWFLLGYSLVFSDNPDSKFLGSARNGAFLRLDNATDYASVKSKGIPGMLFGLFQGMFAAFTVAIITGVVAEKGNLLPFVLFSLLWTTCVYDPIAYWTWNSGGWANMLGTLDWAGGTPVHISSGAASFAYAIFLRHQRVHGPLADTLRSRWQRAAGGSGAGGSTSAPAEPVRQEARLISHNMTNALLGTMLVWFGWFGFNAGSELHANMRAASTFISSNMAACCGAVVYTICERAAGQRWTGLGFCTGAFVGLVAITPAAGYVPSWSGLVIGGTAAVVCFLATSWRALKRYIEEPLDIFIVHGIGGLWGMLMTGIFADKNVALLDGTILPGGCLNGHPIQLVYQIAGGAAGFGWSFFITLVLLFLTQLLSLIWPGMALRAHPRQQGEQVRLDDQLGDLEAYRILYRQPAGNRASQLTFSGTGVGQQVPPQGWHEMSTVPPSGLGEGPNSQAINGAASRPARAPPTSRVSMPVPPAGGPGPRGWGGGEYVPPIPTGHGA